MTDETDPLQDTAACPIQVVYGPDDRYDCTLPRGHEGAHQYAERVHDIWESTFRARPAVADMTVPPEADAVITAALDACTEQMWARAGEDAGDGTMLARRALMTRALIAARPHMVEHMTLLEIGLYRALVRAERAAERREAEARG